MFGTFKGKRGAVPEIGEYPFVVGAEFDHTAAADGGDKSNVNAVQQPSPGGTCNNSVGYENVTQFFGGHGCRQGSPNYECWRDNVAAKMKGKVNSFGTFEVASHLSSFFLRTTHRLLLLLLRLLLLLLLNFNFFLWYYLSFSPGTPAPPTPTSLTISRPSFSLFLLHTMHY